MSASLSEMEARGGVSGYYTNKETLEKVSERKSELDEEKGKTLNEISGIIQNLISTINSKKGTLAPVIQELRTLRSRASDLESEYHDKKRLYDATMVGIDSDAVQLEQEVKGYRQDISNDQSRFHYLSTMINLTDINQERILQEMKSYIGGDDLIEVQQKARGFKTYRDYYNKKIAEQENHGRNLREQQKDIKVG
ncbi:Intraflagellar transport protein 81 [Cladochytrium tenue]|nr:Intraflagellar transport protein 81 [Cladochytrium tenue]